MMRWAGGVIALALATGARADGLVEAACLASAHAPGPQVCACAHEVADRALGPEDRALAARIIAEPDLYDRLARSPAPAAQSFLARYERWGAAAARACR